MIGVMEDMDKQLPNGWVEVELGEICQKPQYGWTSKSTSLGRIKYLRTTDISKGKINWENVPFCTKEPEELTKYILKKNDIVVSRAGSVGISYILDDLPYDAVFASYLIRFNPIIISSHYVAYYLQSKSYWNAISNFSAGIAVPNINATKLSRLPIPLPPLAEQQRIVTRLDALMHHIHRLQERLEGIPKLLKEFRQSVLAQAVTGKLTEDWRAEHGVNLEDWENKKLREFAKVVDPQPSHRTPPNSPDNVPYIGMKDVDKSKKINFKNAKKVSFKVLKEHINRYDLQKDDFFIGKIGTLGNPVFLPILEQRTYTLSANIILIQNRDTNINSRFIYYYFDSPIFEQLIILNSKSTSQPAFGITKTKNLNIPLPPFEEQQAIVKKVEALFSVADRIEARYEAMQAELAQLSQSVLAKAFRGDLVPQDPTDEPASVLLERIQAERAAAAAAKQAAKPKRKSRKRKK